MKGSGWKKNSIRNLEQNNFDYFTQIKAFLKNLQKASPDTNPEENSQPINHLIQRNKEGAWLEEKIDLKSYPVITSFKQSAYIAPTQEKMAYSVKL